jgi:hypothetical protein
LSLLRLLSGRCCCCSADSVAASWNVGEEEAAAESPEEDAIPSVSADPRLDRSIAIDN